MSSFSPPIAALSTAHSTKFLLKELDVNHKIWEVHGVFPCAFQGELSD